MVYIPCMCPIPLMCPIPIFRHEMSVAKRCNLILIDEAHFLNEAPRGATLEAAVSRMQTIHEGSSELLRFIAISATIPNIEDLATCVATSASFWASSRVVIGGVYHPTHARCAVLYVIVIPR